jgi:hypothetical protein
MCRVTPEEWGIPQNKWVLPNIMTCQKFCNVSGGNLITHSFSSRSREGISSGKALSPGQGITKMGPALCYHLMCPYYGNALDLGLYPTRKAHDRIFIFFHYFLLIPDTYSLGITRKVKKRGETF